MPNQVNFWPFLSPETRAELIQLAITFDVDNIYVWRKTYYERRNSFIIRRYHQLRKETNMTKKGIYEKISQEASEIFGEVTAKAVEHVIYDSPNSRHTSTIPGLTKYHM